MTATALTTLITIPPVAWLAMAWFLARAEVTS